MVLLSVALAIGRAACDRDGQCRAPRLDVSSQGGPNACLAYFAQATDQAALKRAVEHCGQWQSQEQACSGSERGLARSARAAAVQIWSNPREDKLGCAQRDDRRYCNKTFVFDGQNTCCQDLVSGNT